MLPVPVSSYFGAVQKKEHSRRTVFLSELPAGINPTKIKLAFEKESGVKLENIKVENGQTVITLITEQDLKLFIARCPKSISFGGKTHPVRVYDQNLNAGEVGGVAHASPQTSGREHHEIMDDAVKIYCDMIYNWHCITKLSSAKKGILVQHIDETINPSQIKNYFEDRGSLGGPISEMYFMIDGILLLFRDNSSVENVWRHRPHRILGKPVVVFLKAVPEFYTDRFIVEPKNDQANRHDVEERIAKNFYPDQSFNVKLCPTQNMLVTFDQDLGVRKMEEIAQNFHDNSQNRIDLLRKTDCLRVECINGLSDAEIISLFENKDKTDGGPVTRIDHLKGNAALLYFASYEDAEAVYKKFQGKNLLIFGFEVKIFRYYHCLYDNHFNVIGKNNLDELIEKDGWPQLKFLYNYVDAKICDFLREKRDHIENLNNKLKDLATVKCKSDGLLVSLITNPEKKYYSSSEMMGVQHKCRRVIESFLKGYTYATLPDSDKAMLKDDKNIFLKTYGRDTVTIIGPTTSVERYLWKHAKSKELEEKEGRWFERCEITKKLQKSGASIILMGNVLQYSGSNEKEIERIQKDIDGYLQDTDERVFVHSENIVTELLCAASDTDEFNSRLRKVLKKEYNVIIIARDGTPYLYGSRNELDDAQSLINDALSVTAVEFLKVPPGVLQDRRCANIQKMQKDGTIKATVHFVKEHSGRFWKAAPVTRNQTRPETGEMTNMVKIAGFSAEVKKAKDILQDGFSDEILCAYAYKFQTKRGVAEYLMTFDQDFRLLCKNNSVTCTNSPKVEETIILRGRKKAVNKVVDELQKFKFEDRVHQSNKLLEGTSVERFLQTEDGKELLQIGGSEFNTVVTVAHDAVSNMAALPSSSTTPEPSRDVRDYPAITENSRGNQLAEWEKPLQIGPLHVNIFEGDITNAKSDAIVISVSPSFDLSKGVMSKAVLGKAGSSIQREIESVNYKNFRMTSGGQISCKKIFHVVMNNQFSKTLFDVLEKAEENSCTSLSIPAIGTGGAGITPSHMAWAMITVLQDFAREYPNPRFLNAIDIVIREKNILQEFTDAAMNSVAGVENAKPRRLTPMVPAFDGKFPVQFNSFKVDVFERNIIKQKTDVIVNSVGSDFNLNNGMVSQAILKKGGRHLQTELDRASGTDLCVTSGGNLSCRHLIHAVTWWDMDVQDRVVAILHKAEKMKCKSISFPALGTGKLGVPLKECAKLMHKAFLKFVENMLPKETCIEKVDIVIYDKNQFKDFVAGFFEIEDVKNQAPISGFKTPDKVAEDRRKHSPQPFLGIILLS